MDGEAIIINLSSGVYYSLDGSGALVWALLDQGHDTSAIAEKLAKHWNLDRARASSDVEKLVQELVEEGLIVPAENGGKPSAPADAQSPGGEYEPPVVQKYADLGDLLALDPPMPGIGEISWPAPKD